MEKSIEEDINRINYIFEFQKKMSCQYVLETEDEKAIKHLLSEYRRLQKENEELKTDLYSANSIINEYVDTYKDCISKEIELSSEDVKAMLENPEKYFKIRTACYKG